jgi:hypothetical protein
MGPGLCVIPNVHGEHDVRVSEHDGSSKPNSISSRPIGDPPAVRSSPSNSVTTPLSFMLSDVVLPRVPPSMTSRETSPNTASAKGTHYFTAVSVVMLTSPARPPFFTNPWHRVA